MIAAMTGLLDEQPLQACALTRITAVPDGSEQALVTKDAVPTARCAVPHGPGGAAPFPVFDLKGNGASDGARTRDLRRDRPAL